MEKAACTFKRVFKINNAHFAPHQFEYGFALVNLPRFARQILRCGSVESAGVINRFSFWDDFFLARPKYPTYLGLAERAHRSIM